MTSWPEGVFALLLCDVVTATPRSTLITEASLIAKVALVGLILRRLPGHFWLQPWFLP